MGPERDDAPGFYHVDTVRAIDVTLGHRLWNGLGYSANDFNYIEWIRTHVVREIRWVLTTMRSLPCTGAHRIVDGPATYKAGIAVSSLKKGSKVLISDAESPILDSVMGVPAETGRFRVVSYGLRHRNEINTSHLMVVNDFISHNLKDPRDPGAF